MGVLRRRRKSALALLALAIVVLAYWLRARGPRAQTYTAGEAQEGLTDRLALEAHAQGPALRFREVAREAGLDFRHFPGTRSNRLPEDMAGGVALGDFDGDGWTDVFLTNASGPMEGGLEPAQPARSRLYRNLGGRFEDVSEASGIDLSAQAMAAAFCDVDSDGDLDLFVSCWGHCRLYTNQGQGRFVDTSERAGLLQYEGFWTGIGVADFDLDGALDLYVCGYVRYEEGGEHTAEDSSQYGVSIPARINPSNFEPIANLLLAGRGDGTFRECAQERGADDPHGRGLGVLFCDLNADGLPDLYVANDVSDNALLLNRGDGSFADRTSRAMVGDYRGAMGLCAADFDGDLDLDIFITHWVAQENALYQLTSWLPEAEGGPRVPLYLDQADRQRLGFQGLRRVGWATRFVDFDNDGLLDLFVVNGSTIPRAEDPLQLQPMQSQLFWNSGGKDRFVEIGEANGGFFAEPHVGRGGATFDYDLDGDEDILVALHGEGPALLRNDGGNARPCVRLRLREPSGNRFANGASVRASIGGRERLELLGTQGSYLSQHAVAELSFGLGDEACVDSIEVRWPGGESERAGPFLAYSLIDWTRGERPRTSPFPGRAQLDRDGPGEVADKRAFFELRKQASEARLAGDAPLAVARYRQALARWPGHADCLYYLGNSYLASGEEAAALDAFTRLVHFDPNSNAGHMQIGLMRLPGGDPALDDLGAARVAFERCRELNREESRPTLQLGIVALLAGELEPAAESFAQVCRQNPRSVEARWFAGLLAYRRGERELAASYLEEARALSRQSGAGSSASNEGDTVAGVAMRAETEIALSPALSRWRSVGQRDGDVEGEFELAD